MITIRNAQMTDFEQIKILEDAVFQFHRQARPDYFKTQYDYTRQEYEELLNRPAPIAYVAVCGERIVGICFGKIEQTAGNLVCRGRKIAVIEDLFTLPEYRRQGIASDMLEKALGQAAAQKAEGMELCVWGFNESALRFYEKHGMQVQFSRMEKRLE